MSTATDMLALYVAAETAIMGGQSYTINGHTFTHANLADVQKGRREWQLAVNKENAGVTGKTSFALADFTDD